MTARKLSVLLATAVAVPVAVLASSSSAQAGGTPSSFLPIGSPCGNTSNFQGSITFEDEGDVFFVHDTCPDGIGVSAEITLTTPGSIPFVFTDANGARRGAAKQVINIPRGEEADVKVCLFDVGKVCESMRIAE
jgi:hypothetical protein